MRFARNLSPGAISPSSPSVLAACFLPTVTQVIQQCLLPSVVPDVPPPAGALDVSRQATQECLSGENLKVAARAGQGVGGAVLKSGSLELSSVSGTCLPGRKLCEPAGEPKAGHQLL